MVVVRIHGGLLEGCLAPLTNQRQWRYKHNEDRVATYVEGGLTSLERPRLRRKGM